MAENSNGNVGAPTASLVLTADLAAGTVHADFTGPNLEVALDMLARATRLYEGELRWAQAQQKQKQLLKGMQDRAIVGNLRGLR